MRTKTRILCFAWMLIFCLSACVDPAALNLTDPTPAIEAAATPDGGEDISVVAVSEPTAIPTPEPTEEPTAEPTEEPTPTPAPTRPPMEGDIAVNFPNYDTGVDADYSYQSDELRIAIKVVVDAEAKQTYYVADIWMRNINSFRTAFGKGEFKKGVEDGDALARRENAILAVNGSYNQGMMIQSGKVLQKLRADRHL